MNYTEEELCTLVDQLPDIQYNLQMPVTSINLLGLTPDLFDEEVYEILSSFDNANIEILSDIISGFRFASEHNIKTTNEQLQAFRQNMHWDLGFMLRVISLDFKSLEKTSFSNKKALISEMEKLVSKYAQLSEMHNIEEY